MTTWFPSVLATMGFPLSSNVAPKRRATSDERGSTKAPRCRPGQYSSAVDGHMAQHENPVDEVTPEFSPAEFDAGYESAPDTESISDTESLSFDGLYPVLPQSTPLAVTQTQIPAKKFLSPPKSIMLPPKAIASSSKAVPSKPTSTAPVPNSPSAPWAKGLLLSQKWSTRPNKRAREIVSDVSNPRTSIVNEIQEPEYALRDVEIREGLEELKNLMCEFSDEHFKFEIKVAGTSQGQQILLQPKFFEQFTEEAAKVIGCVASGGPGGVQGWHELFVEPVKRMALVTGIVGNVLVEQVFQYMFFGGAERQVAELVKMQKKHAEADGFVRNTHYATYIRSVLDPKATNSFTLPSNFANHVNHIVGVLVTHLAPILKLNPTSPSGLTLIPNLHTIVTHAGVLSLNMRADPHTVYHFTPVFKEESFSHSRMECFNARTMQQTNPHTSDTEPGLCAAEKKRRAALPGAEKRRSRNDDALTQITILDGITAYRLGGWEEFDSKVTNVRYEKMEFASQGVRERVLSKAWTYCRWGRARAFKNGRADDKAAHHGVAWKGGFAEFTEVEGVKDWLEIERAEKKKAREVWEADVQADMDEEHRAGS